MVLSNESMIAYCAGLFEGEGSIGAREMKGRNGSKSRTIYIQFIMTDFEPLDTFEDYIGKVLDVDGAIYGPHEQRGLGSKPIYRLGYSGYVKVKRIVDAMWPLLSSRRQEQALKALTFWENYDCKTYKGVLVGGR